jgi:hypothetical protein
MVEVTEKNEDVTQEVPLVEQVVEPEDEVNEVSVFTKHLKQSKDDFKFVTSVRREVIQLIEPFR